MKKKILSFIHLARRMHLGTRVLALVLTLVLAFYAVPSVVFAEAGEAISAALASDGGSSETSAEKSRGSGASDGSGESYLYDTDLYEVVELREESAKHFHLPDGTYIAAQYPYPVHIMDESGKLADIDNELLEDGDSYGNKSARIKFAKKITGNETLFTLSENNTKITLSLIGAEKGVAGTVTNGTDAEEDTELGKKLNLERLTASVTYADILPAVDLEYVVHGLNVKENIIVKERADAYSYSFELKLNNLTAELTESGDVRILDSLGEVKYIIPAPIVFDAAGTLAPEDKAYYTLTADGKQYTLTVTADHAWMNAEDRVFPVTVDPSLTAYGSSSIVDTYINEESPSSSFHHTSESIVSSASIMYAKAILLPDIPDTAYISNVSFSVSSNWFAGSGYVGAYEVTADWGSFITWNSYSDSANPTGTLGTAVQDYCHITSAGTHVFDVTELGKKWYSGTNYGLALKAISGTSDFETIFYTSKAALNKPTVTVSYVDMGGVEDYMPLTSHTLGAAGTGNVNLATGQLNISVPLIGTTDSLMPLTLSLVYNSDMAQKQYCYPNAETAYDASYVSAGWKLNICQTVIAKAYTKEDGTIGTFYTYLDADGTAHAFYVSEDDTGVFYDEDGLKMKLTVGSDGNIEITDPSQQVLKFSAMPETPATEVTGAWYLSEIRDLFGNAVRFTFDTSCRPTKVSLVPKGLAAIDMLQLHYNSYGFVDAIYNLTSGDAVIIRYSDLNSGAYTTKGDDYLRAIEFVHSESSSASRWIRYASSAANSTGVTVKATATYTYYAQGYIYAAADMLKTHAVHHEWSGGKLVFATQTGDSGSYGQKLGFSYTDGYTEIQSSGNDDTYGTADDIKTRYIFDERGRAVSTYSYSSDLTEIYGAVAGEYEKQENAKNNLASETVLSNSVPNLLLNGTFNSKGSNGEPTHWSYSGTASKSYGEDYILITPSANTSAKLMQYVTVSSGMTYTLCFIAETKNCADIAASVSIIGGAKSYVEEIPLELGNQYNLSVVSVTFATAESSGSVRIDVDISAGDTAESANIKLYHFMLSEGIGVPDYNAVAISDFYSSYTSASNYWTTQSGSAPTIVTDTNALFGAVAKVNAVNYSESYIKQRIFEVSEDEIIDMQRDQKVTNANKTYIVSGFGKAASAMPSGRGVFAIRVDVHYYQGIGYADIVKSYYFNLSPSCGDWQFAGGSFTTKYDDTHYDEDGNYVNEPGGFNWVRAIDIVCDYSYQAQGYALFDRISVCETTSDRTDYTYYENGMLRAAESFFYSEYYEYNDKMQLTRVANNQGELTDYEYTSRGELYRVVEYGFVNNDTSLIYPAYAADPDSGITKTAKIKTSYGYNSYGLMVEEQTGYVTETDSGLEFVSGAPQIDRRYTYETSATSRIFGAMLRCYVPAVENVRYIYDTKNGRLLASVDVYSDSGVAYTYDEVGTLVSVRPASYNVSSDSYVAETNTENVTYTYDSKKQLSTVTTDSTTYTFTYDVYGNTSSIKAGDSTLAEYSYNNYNGKLNKITYGNGFSEEYVYNEVELLSEIWYNYSDGTREQVYSYEYTKDGQLYKFYDHIEDRYTVYRYTGTGKLARMVQYDGEDMEYGLSLYCTYNNRDFLDLAKYRLSYYEGSASAAANVLEQYVYNSDGTLSDKAITANGLSACLSYTYDDFDRVAGVELTVVGSNNNTPTLTIDYGYTYRTYTDGIGTYTDGYVSTFTSTVNGTTRTYTYEYDSNGNITKITDSGGETVEYEYDNLNQLTSALHLDGYLYNYRYDKAGNIIGKVIYFYDAWQGTYVVGDSGTFTYESSEWGDRMVSTQGIATTYDELGNPLTYYNAYFYCSPEMAYTFTWEGRQLSTVVYNGKNASYAYNDDGIRTSKTVDGVTTTYHLNGSQIIAEETDTYIIVYLYDAAGSPIGMQYREFTYDTGVWDSYFFEKNMLGDIVAVYDANGTKLMYYTYDASGQGGGYSQNGGQNTGAAKNPFRYRGYYYDKETGFYYLNSRYYDPILGRFISPDSYVSTGQGLLGYNMYAYCNNNPVKLVDSSGEKPMPFKELSWPGYIHREIQEYLNDTYGYIIEHSLSGGRVDLVIGREAYEIKPFTASKSEAIEQLQEYIELSGGTLVAGGYHPELTGTLPSSYAPGYTVKFYYTGDGIIQYSFYKTPNKVTAPYAIKSPEKQKNNTAQKAVAGAAALGLSAAFLFGGGGGKIYPFRELGILSMNTY